MRKEPKADVGKPDEELRDILIAISVVARRLATKMEKPRTKGGKKWKRWRSTRTSTMA